MGIVARLREWSILLTGLGVILAGIIYAASVSSISPEPATVATVSASPQPPASPVPVASKSSAPAAPQNLPAAQAPRPAPPVELGDVSTPGVARANCTRDGWPRAGATAALSGGHRHGGEHPSSGATHCSNCRATRCPSTPNIGRRNGSRRRCGGGPPSLPKMPGLPLAGGRQERARAEPGGHYRQEVG